MLSVLGAVCLLYCFLVLVLVSVVGGVCVFPLCMCLLFVYLLYFSLLYLCPLSRRFFVAQVVCAFWGFVFLGWFLGCLVVVCGGCFLFFGVCRGFCFVGVVVFGVSFCLVDVVLLFVLFFACGLGRGVCVGRCVSVGERLGGFCRGVVCGVFFVVVFLLVWCFF